MNTNIQATHGHGDFIAGSVRIVDFDTANNNVLVRGSSSFGTKVPATGNDFVIGDLISAIQSDVNYSSITKAGIKLHENPFVIDFCLIGFVAGHKDQHIVNAEMKWFTSTPPVLSGEAGPYPVHIPSTNPDNPGMMVYWPIQAIGCKSPTQPKGTWAASPENSIGTGSAGTGFDFSGLVPAIWFALTNNVPLLQAKVPTGISAIQNAIIYVHCDSGVNRTGAAVAGYLMTQGSNLAALSLPSRLASPYSLAQAQAAANKAPPSNDTSIPGGSDIWVAEAYCNYLSTTDYDAALVEACVPNPVPGTNP